MLLSLTYKKAEMSAGEISGYENGDALKNTDLLFRYLFS